MDLKFLVIGNYFIPLTFSCQIYLKILKKISFIRLFLKEFYLNKRFLWFFLHTLFKNNIFFTFNTKKILWTQLFNLKPSNLFDYNLQNLLFYFLSLFCLYTQNKKKINIINLSQPLKFKVTYGLSKLIN